MKLLKLDFENEISNIIKLITNTCCIVCGTESKGHRLCEKCAEKVNNLSPAFLIHNNMRIYYYGLYKETLSDFIIAYKYNNHHSLSKEFSKMLYKAIVAHNISFEIVAYVPATKSAKKKRGYDHMKLIAKEFSKITKIPYINALIAVRETDQLTAKNRQEAVKGKFMLREDKSYIIKDRSVLLIDDVYTTGSTMREVSNILKRYGTKEVIPLVIAMNR